MDQKCNCNQKLKVKFQVLLQALTTYLVHKLQSLLLIRSLDCASYLQFRILTLKLIDGKFYLESCISFETSTTSNTFFYPHDSWNQNSK